jgi:hypothetical protein
MVPVITIIPTILNPLNLPASTLSAATSGSGTATPSTSSTPTSSLYVSSGNVLVDMSVIPYMRAREVEFFATNLRPYRPAYFFFDDTNINRFVQIPSSLVLDTSSNALFANVGDGIYCSNTGGYATIVGYSPPPSPPTTSSSAPITGGTLYLNENYISINVAVIPPTPSSVISSLRFNVGDIIYQAPESQVSVVFGSRARVGVLGSNTFTGKVEYWNPNDRVLVVSPISGTLYSNNVSDVTPNTSSFIYVGNTAAVITALEILPLSGNNKFIDGVTITNVRTNKNYLTLGNNSYIHNSGRIGNQLGDETTVTLAANVASQNPVGKNLYITSGTGLGQSRIINNLSLDGGTVYLNEALSPFVDGSSTYSIGDLPQVDDNGIICGIYQLPETQTVEFLTGTRVFTITDTPIVNDVNATMIAKANYVSQGFLKTYQTIRTTPVPALTPHIGPGDPVAPASPTQVSSAANPSNIVDSSSTTLASTLIDYTNSLPPLNPQIQPIAQTFTTPPPKSTKQNYGIFATSVYLWFYSKPQRMSPQFPVNVQIVETVNGLPTSKIVGSAMVECQNVNLVNNDTPNPDVSSSNNATKFIFNDPVYLQPSTEYAIVVSSQSPDYSVYISELGQSDISTVGNGISRVSSAPYVGSFFMSQNASQWNPIQNQTLMFVLNKASFSQDPVNLQYNIDPLPQVTWADSITLTSSDLILPSTMLTYKIKSDLYDKTSNTFYQDPTFAEVHSDNTYFFGQDTSTPSSSTVSRRRYIPSSDASGLQLEIDMESFDSDVSPIYNEETLAAIVGTNFINNGGISSSDITITSDSGGHADAANLIVSIDSGSPYQLANSIPALGTILASQLDASGNITGVTITQSGTGYVKAPTITIQDITPGYSGTTTATVAGEDQKYGGNALARYVTKKVTLADGFDSGDLRVWVDGVIPTGTSAQVYYKVLSASDTEGFIDKKWQLMTPVNPINSPDLNTTVEIQYASKLVGGKPTGTLSYVDDNGITNPVGGTFKYFAVKIVLFAQDPSVMPILTGMRVMALPAG